MEETFGSLQGRLPVCLSFFERKDPFMRDAEFFLELFDGRLCLLHRLCLKDDHRFPPCLVANCTGDSILEVSSVAERNPFDIICRPSISEFLYRIHLDHGFTYMGEDAESHGLGELVHGGGHHQDFVLAESDKAIWLVIRPHDCMSFDVVVCLIKYERGLWVLLGVRLEVRASHYMEVAIKWGRVILQDDLHLVVHDCVRCPDEHPLNLV